MILAQAVTGYHDFWRRWSLVTMIFGAGGRKSGADHHVFGAGGHWLP